MIMAEISFYNCHNSTHQPRILFQSLPYGLVGMGLYLCSYPDQYSEQAAWSAQLTHIGQTIFPRGSNISRYFASVGAQMVCFGVMFSPSMRKVLSHRALLWLGSISFPIYLLHGPLMRSVLVYLLYFPTSIGFGLVAREDGTANPETYIPTPHACRLGIILTIFFTFLLYVAQLWKIYVEPKMGAATNSFERFSRSWGEMPNQQLQQEHDLLPLYNGKKS
jgi:peptidoglycan/LPS O-acetylase OafA/YrhL